MPFGAVVHTHAFGGFVFIGWVRQPGRDPGI